MNEKIGEYSDYGYCLFKGMVPSGELDKLREEILSAIEEYKQSPGYLNLKTKQYRDFAAGLHLKKKSVSGLLNSKPFVDLATTLLGGEADLRFTSTMTKTRDKPSALDWHQDSAYDKDPEHEKYICWLAITDSNRENGCLKLIPKSHKAGLVKHVTSKLHAPDLEIETVDEIEAIDIEMRAGDVIVLSPFLFHASWPNISGKTRIALLAGFMKPKKEYLESELKASRKYLRNHEKCWEKVENEVAGEGLNQMRG